MVELDGKASDVRQNEVSEGDVVLQVLKRHQVLMPSHHPKINKITVLPPMEDDVKRTDFNKILVNNLTIQAGKQEEK